MSGGGGGGGVPRMFSKTNTPRFTGEVRVGLEVTARTAWPGHTVAQSDRESAAASRDAALSSQATLVVTRGVTLQQSRARLLESIWPRKQTRKWEGTGRGVDTDIPQKALPVPGAL